MVELVEYMLVFGLTVTISVLGFVILGGALPVLSQTQTKAQLEEIQGAADLAAIRGNATLIMPLSNVSLDCSQGDLTLSSGGSSYSAPYSYPCSFSLGGVSCLCTLVFTRSQGVVQLMVKS